MSEETPPPEMTRDQATLLVRALGRSVPFRWKSKDDDTLVAERDGLRLEVFPRKTGGFGFTLLGTPPNLVPYGSNLPNTLRGAKLQAECAALHVLLGRAYRALSAA